ncbi:MAG: hypothetical protein CSA95_05755 [Bacteroidetes bacterium]|nr:MAG: hypothetical protein CSA95_05755 [Bacteroidota bacterium]PIE87725.1 MAG: hypothetical protein CSA04_05540 [Bacteroidota bacterium]
MKKYLRLHTLSVILVILFSLHSFAQERIAYPDHKYQHGIQLEQASKGGLSVTFSIEEFSLENRDIKGEKMQSIELPGTFLPNDEGMPDLPGQSRFIMIPQGAKASFTIREANVETYSNVTIAPAPRIPLDTETGDLEYHKKEEVYAQNAFYPPKPVQLSSHRKVRGVDMVMLGITPFQYNPVTKELKVYRDLKVEITFQGGNGHFGEDRLRSPYWDPIVKDMALNASSLEPVDYNQRLRNRDTKNNVDLEYIIISPDAPMFQAWGGVIKNHRTKQGIITGVVSLSEIGGNTPVAIENYINNAYNNWNIPPAAVLILGDYGTNQDNSVTSPIWDNYCVSDNIYADVDEDNLPDIVFARITARDEDELSLMINKFINYENNPPLSFDFYKKPITALGWQTPRWFQICSETVGGFWKNELGKEPVRINEIYSGTPGSVWSTAQNTSTVVNYFGVNGLGYIPATPAELGNWSGGNAAMINNAINAGAFMLMHRDHGGETGWGEPDYDNNDILGTTNTDLTFILSINCLTGKYNWSSECFTEAFHRHDYGALGLIAASEVSYSFVNDTYTWGMIDHMWTNFMPDYGQEFPTNFIRPAFGSAAGKYFLEGSNWPYNTNNKTVTYHLFHAHTDAFTSVYSEMPTEVAIEYMEVLPIEQDFFEFTCDEGAMVCLTYENEIIGVAEANGSLQQMTIEPMTNAGDSVLITVTARNKFRYEDYILVAGTPFPSVNPSPADQEKGVAPFTPFTWSDGIGNLTDTFKIYIGTDNPPTNIVNGEETLEPLFSLEENLEYNTNYFWRVDSYNEYGTVEGTTWSFETGDEPDEDFETGDFSAFGWYSNGDAEWSVSNEEAASGSFAAQSGQIDAIQTTSLFLDVHIDAFLPQKITYWAKMNASGSSSLAFYVDGELKDNVVGTFDWSLRQPLVDPGEHTLEWRFSTGEISSGDEKAWIDFIHFPPLFNGVSVNAGENASLCDGDIYETEATASNYQNVMWSSDGTGVFDDPQALQTLYTPSQEDYEAGTVTLTIDVWDNENNHKQDNVVLTFIDAPLLTAEDGAICGTAPALISWVTITNYASIHWATTGDGSFDDPTLEQPTYTCGSQDIANGEVEFILTVQGNSPCKEAEETLTVIVSDDPATPNQPEGTDYVDTHYTTTTEYTTEGNTLLYNWELQPEEAGTLLQGEATTTVTWNVQFEGIATLKVNGENSCGISDFSEGIEITVVNTVGVHDEDLLHTRITPNPTHGTVAVSFKVSGEYTLSIYNALGKSVYHAQETTQGEVHKQIDLGTYGEGIYSIVIENRQNRTVRKIIVNK